MRVVCAGHVNWDIRLRVDRLPVADGEARIHSRTESGGGSAANVAVALAGLDREARMFGSVGDDEAGERAVGRLEDAGVDTRIEVVPNAETTRKYILVDDDGEVALLGFGGANEAVGPDDVSPSLLEGASAVHLTGQRPETAAAIADLAADHDRLVSFDPGRRVFDRDYGAVYPATDLLFVNDREDAAVDADVPWRVVKHGAEGATLFGPDTTVSHPGFDVGAAVDTTGAGDAFAAGFLAAWLEARDPERALAVANACGAIAASQHGSQTTLSWDRIDALR